MNSNKKSSSQAHHMEGTGSYIYIALLLTKCFQLDYLITLVSNRSNRQNCQGLPQAVLFIVFNSLPSAATPGGIYKPP